MGERAPVSCYIRTLNEHRRIAQVNASVRGVVSEIVVVDSGSTTPRSPSHKPRERELSIRIGSATDGKSGSANISAATIFYWTLMLMKS
jgi:hypothetical protein